MLNTVIFDTNALIHFFKQVGGTEPYLDLITTILTAIEYPPATCNDHVTFVQPTVETYKKAIEFSTKLRTNGTPIPAIDILIAAIVVENDATLVSDDAHFDEICSFEPKLERIALDGYLASISLEDQSGSKP